MDEGVERIGESEDEEKCCKVLSPGHGMAFALIKSAQLWPTAQD